jgi:DNA-binding transcriptional ArsR family regulator
MEMEHAVDALGALAQDTRLAVFRHLVEAGHDGRRAGLIADALGLPNATLSFHLSQLRQAGLVSARREGRRIIYAADYARMTALIEFLTANCCAGHGTCDVPDAAPPVQAAVAGGPAR